jgi:hypothetical protein
MQRGKLCIVLAALCFLYHLQLFAQTSDTTRVLSLENAWNEAESHKDVKALDALLAPPTAGVQFRTELRGQPKGGALWADLAAVGQSFPSSLFSPRLPLSHRRIPSRRLPAST